MNTILTAMTWGKDFQKLIAPYASFCQAKGDPEMIFKLIYLPPSLASWNCFLTSSYRVS